MFWKVYLWERGNSSFSHNPTVVVYEGGSSITWLFEWYRGFLVNIFLYLKVVIFKLHSLRSNFLQLFYLLQIIRFVEVLKMFIGWLFLCCSQISFQRAFASKSETGYCHLGLNLKNMANEEQFQKQFIKFHVKAINRKIGTLHSYF